MELFTIHCTTCKARLVVRDASVIGEILSCPKCNSMVQVVPPVGWKRAGSGDRSQGALAVVPQAPQPPAPASELPAAEELPVSRAPAKKVAAAAIPPALPRQPASPPATAAATSNPAPATAAAAAVSAAAGRRFFAMAAARAKRDWILLSGGLLGGVVLGVAIWLVVAVQTPAPIVADAPLGDTSPAEPTVPPASKSSRPPEPPAESPRKQVQTAAP